MMLRATVSRRCFSSASQKYATLTPPLVDVRCFHEEHSRSTHAQAQRVHAGAATSAACRTHGLLALPAYGGIDPGLVAKAFASVHQLFELPLEKKLELEYRDVRENVGYIKAGNEKPDPNEQEPE